MAAEAARGVDANGEAEFVTERFEAVDAGFGLVPKAEVFAFVKLGDVEGLLENVSSEVVSSGLRELGGKGQDEQGVDAGGGEECDLFRERSDKGLAGFRADDAGRVRVEGDGDGGEAERASTGDDFGDDPLMAEVDAVKVADGGYGRAEVAGDFRELAIDFHQAISNWS